MSSSSLHRRMRSQAVSTCLLLVCAFFAIASCDRDTRGYALCETDEDCEGELTCMFQRENALGVCSRTCEASSQCEDSSAGGVPVEGYCGPFDERGNWDPPGRRNVCVWRCSPRNDPPYDSSCSDPEYECFGENPMNNDGICIGRASE